MDEALKIEELSRRVRLLEQEVMRLKNSRDSEKPKKNWVEEVSGSMKDIPDEDYDEAMRMGRALASGKLKLEDL